jgi:hypothetical protein
MNVRLPNGTVIKNVPDDVSQAEVMRIAIKNHLATPEDFNQTKNYNNLPTGAVAPGWIASLAEDISGEKRMTPEMDKLPPVGNAPELNAMSVLAAKMGWMQLFGSDKSQMDVLSEMGATFRTDEKGNDIVDLPSGSYALNKPGLSPSDASRFVAQTAAMGPAAEVAGPIRAGLAMGATEAATEGITSALGGDNMSPVQIGVATIAGWLPPAVRSKFSSLVESAGKTATEAELEAAAKVAGAEDAESQRILSKLSPEAVGYALAHSGADRDAAIKALAEKTGQNFDKLKAAIDEADKNSDKRLVSLTKSGLRGDLSKIAKETNTNADRIKIAQELGLNTDILPASWFSDNQQFIEFYQALKNVNASILSPIEREGLEQTAKAADRLVKEAGGTTDISDLDERVKGKFAELIDTLETQSNAIYEMLGTRVPGGTAAPAKNTLALIEKKLSTRNKDISALDPVSRDILQRISPKKLEDGTLQQPTYDIIDDVRRDIGNALGRKSGPYADAKRRELKEFYDALTDDQDAVLSSEGLDKDLQTAKSLVASRKRLEEKSIKLFGKDIAKSLVPELKGAVDAAKKGDASKIKRVMNSLPEDLRPEVAASALHYLLNTGGRGADRAVSIAGFVDAFEGLQRNRAARDALFEYLTPEAREKIGKFYTFAKGVHRAISAVPKNGNIVDIKQEFRAADTMAEKILAGSDNQWLKSGEWILSHTPLANVGYGLVKGGAKAALKESVGTAPEERMAKGIDLLASPEFQQAARVYANRKVASDIAIKQADAALKRSARYKVWHNTLSTVEKQLIDRLGPYKTFAYWATLRYAEDNGDSNQ